MEGTETEIYLPNFAGKQYFKVNGTKMQPKLLENVDKNNTAYSKFRTWSHLLYPEKPYYRGTYENRLLVIYNYSNSEEFDEEVAIINLWNLALASVMATNYT